MRRRPGKVSARAVSFRQRELVYSEAVINCLSLGIKSKRAPRVVDENRENRASPVFSRRALVRNRITGPSATGSIGRLYLEVKFQVL